MTRFYFTLPGESLTPEQLSLGFVAVPISDPGTPNAGYAWELGNPQAVQVNGVWQQNWVQAPIPLAAARQSALQSVAATLAGKLAAGLAIGSNVVAIDASAQQKIGSLAILALATIGGTATTPWPTDRTWPVVSGTPIPLTTPQDLINIGTPAAHYVWSLDNFAGNLVDQINTSTATASSIAALDLDNSQGTWPTS